MTVRRKSDNRDKWIGLSTDQKPPQADLDSIFFEEDTGTIFRWNGFAWVSGFGGGGLATKITHSEAQEIGPQTTKTLDFDTVLFGSMLQNGNKLVVPESGFWIIGALVELDGNINALVQAFIRKNDTTTIALVDIGSTANALNTVNLVSLEQCVAGDFFKFMIFNGSINQTIQAAIESYTPRFSIVKVG